MSEAEEYYKEYREKDGQITTLDDLMNFAQSYADKQIKEKMPSDDEIEKAADVYAIYSMEVEAFMEGIEWLKQKLNK